MSTVLHILNGDTTLHSFAQTGLDGDIMVWREVLCTGPLEGAIDTAGFWNLRKEWITQTFGDTEEGYEQKVMQELARLNEPYQEINLWFDADLHCQVNMLGAMMMLKRQANLSAPKINLVSPQGNLAAYPKNIAELSRDELEDLYDARLGISEVEFYAGTEAWQAYRQQDAGALKRYLNTHTFWGNLHWLKGALKAQVKRLTVNESGLNGVEQLLLGIYQSGLHQREAIYQAFWQQNPVFGFGDNELDVYLKRLQQRQLINL